MKHCICVNRFYSNIRYLWSLYEPKCTDEHVLSIVYMVLAKPRDGVSCWQCFIESDELFEQFFRRTLRLAINSEIDLRQKTQIFRFLALVFRDLDIPLLRKQVAPLVSVQLWHNIISTKRDSILSLYPTIGKAWRGANKKFEKLQEEAKTQVEFCRNWLVSGLLDFYSIVCSQEMKDRAEDSHSGYYDYRTTYIETFLEFVISMLSQLPTRRYTLMVLKDYNFSAILHLHVSDKHFDLSSLSPSSVVSNIDQLVDLTHYYLDFPINEFTGEALTNAQQWKLHGSKVANLQQIAFTQYYEKLRILSLGNHASIYNRPDFEEHLSTLSLSELKHLAELLKVRTSFSLKSISVNGAFLIESIYQLFKAPFFPASECRKLSTLPDEISLSTGILQDLDSWGTKSVLPLHKLGLQYLSISDFLIRNFQLFRLEAFTQVRADLEKTLQRFSVKNKDKTDKDVIIDANYNTNKENDQQQQQVKLFGHSRLAAKINNAPIILNIAPPAVGQNYPAHVSIEVVLELEYTSWEVRREWEGLRPQEVVYLVSLVPGNKGSDDPLHRSGIKTIWSGEVVQVLDEKNEVIRPDQTPENGYTGRRRKIHINLDGKKYYSIPSAHGLNKEVLNSLNMVIRRPQRENNFKPILDNILSLIENQNPTLSDWFDDLLLGYGGSDEVDQLKVPVLGESFDYWDTFLDNNHFNSTFPEEIINKDAINDRKPPFVVMKAENGSIVSSYRMPYLGPYDEDKKQTNAIRFTANQVKAIVNSIKPGLTMVVGPPGTGKTDVACQVLNLLYHNYRQQRILVLTHSNQALNHIFQKIAKLDIKPRHLLRLGHGQKDLSDYSLYGRVDKLVESRRPLLDKVSKLAESIGLPSDHGDSCETAQYFYEIYVLPAWKAFEKQRFIEKNLDCKFPFSSYFADKPNSAYNSEDSITDEDIYKGNFSHIKRLFEDLSCLRPLEVLWSNRERANYLLLKEARIVAMTATHAAINLKDIQNLGVQFDSVIVEEAGQLTELETVLPLTLGFGSNGNELLKRVVLIGDHYQNTPIIQNNVLRQYSGLGQSLFTRFVRSGVRYIQLDVQGRARPEIASIYAWRYGELKNLAFVEKIKPKTNSGFLYTVQFINVCDYQGHGESEPTKHFVQNLGEAEYAVALYQYMRLLGYPREKITILATYFGQKVLISEILEKRCSDVRIFGIPDVSTVDQYQGQQNDYIILSTVRTSNIGYLRDIRRMTVALSRSRLGLYVVGRRGLLENCAEINGLVSRLIDEREDKLQLVTGEMYGDCIQDRAAVTMESLEHFGQYVNEMTEQKIQYEDRSQLKID